MWHLKTGFIVHMRVVVWIFALAVCFSIPSTSQAQNPFAVKRIVDTSIITNYDISQRVRLLRAFGFRGPDPETLALSQLTEDRLKISAAERNGIGIDLVAQVAPGIPTILGELRATFTDHIGHRAEAV